MIAADAPLAGFAGDWDGEGTEECTEEGTEEGEGAGPQLPGILWHVMRFVMCEKRVPHTVPQHAERTYLGQQVLPRGAE